MNNVNSKSYADYNVIGDDVIHVTESLKEASNELFGWFANNQMNVNPSKCHLITISIVEVSISAT